MADILEEARLERDQAVQVTISVPTLVEPSRSETHVSE